jgi:hypothetical protein
MLWDDLETLLLKVLIEGKDVFDLQAAHSLEATAIHQRKVTAVCGKYIVHTAKMLLFPNPVNLKKGHNIRLQSTYKLEA